MRVVKPFLFCSHRSNYSSFLGGFEVRFLGSGYIYSDFKVLRSKADSGGGAKVLRFKGLHDRQCQLTHDTLCLVTQTQSSIYFIYCSSVVGEN